MVDEVLASGHVPGEAAHPVVHDHDVGLEPVDQVIEGPQRRDAPAGRDIDVGPKDQTT
jgi:hypothetical protein